MKRCIKKDICGLFCVFFLVVCLLTGCGGEYAGVSENGAVSGGAVSGAAVEKEDTEDVKTTEVEQCNYSSFHTDTNMYDYSEDYDGIMCRRLDGTHKKIIKINGLDEILGVRDGYLYYSSYDDYEKCDFLYRVSLQKDNEGYDKVAKETTELLVKEVYGEDEIGILDAYVDSACIFYITCDGDMVRFDLQTLKKKIVEIPVKGLEFEDCKFTGTGNHIVLEVEEEGLFIWEAGEEKWLRLTEHDIYSLDITAWNGEDFFHCGDFECEPDAAQEICRIDLEKRKEDIFVTREQLQQAVKEAEGLNSDEQLEFCAVVDLFCEEDRLYIQTQINWTKEDEYHIGYVVFSQGRKETRLRYEKSLTECMREHGIVRKGKLQADNYSGRSSLVKNMRTKIIKEDVVFYDAWCFAVANGKVFMHCDGFEKEEKQCIGCYELSTGKFRKLTKQNPEFWEPYLLSFEQMEVGETWYNEVKEMILSFLDEADEKSLFIHFVEEEGEGEE